MLIARNVLHVTYVRGGVEFRSKSKANTVIKKRYTLRAGSDAFKIKALRPYVLKAIFWRPTRRRHGIFDQIWSEKLRFFGYLPHITTNSKSTRIAPECLVRRSLLPSQIYVPV